MPAETATEPAPTEVQSLEAVEPAFEKEFAVHGEQVGFTDVSPYEPAGHSHTLRIKITESAVKNPCMIHKSSKTSLPDAACWAAGGADANAAGQQHKATESRCTLVAVNAIRAAHATCRKTQANGTMY